MVKDSPAIQKIWIDAADSVDRGGWQLDTQFTHLMGSSYLIACDCPGEPVKPAKYRFSVAQADHFRIWVRCKNWYFPYTPGLFHLEVDGSQGVSLGNQASNRWTWEIAHELDLSEGTHTINAIDDTGYFGRFSSIIITNDLDYIPPCSTHDFEQERAKIKNISLDPVESGSYDLIVVGGGPGGLFAGLAAARKGIRVLILHDRPVLGGNSSREIGVAFRGASARNIYAREGGLMEEFLRTRYRYGYDASDCFNKLLSPEKNIHVHYNEFVYKVEKQGSLIKSVISRNTLTGKRSIYHGKLFIDASGDGSLIAYSGASYRYGRESKYQFNEKFAPDIADKMTMSGSLIAPKYQELKHEISFKAPEWAPRFPDGSDFGRNIEFIGNHWWLEYPNHYDDVYDAELARDELFRIHIAFYHYLKNQWDKKESAQKYKLIKMPYMNGKRESRRVIGDYTLTQEDCESGKHFDDCIAHSGWPIDLHHPMGVYSGKEGPYFSNSPVPIVEIPYRSTYSKDIQNLFCSGRNISVSHIALGSTRVMATIATVAQAVGTAAAMCLYYNCTPREIYEKHIKTLQETLMRDDQYIPKLRSMDPENLLARAHIDASSYSQEEIFHYYLGKPESFLPLDKQRAVFFSRGQNTHIDCLYIQLMNASNEEKTIQVALRAQDNPDAYTSTISLKELSIVVPADGMHFVAIPVNLEITERYLWLIVNPAKDVSWQVISNGPLDWTRSERLSSHEEFPNIRGETHLVFFHKPIEALANCKAENIVNGYSRPMDSEHYMWVSDPHQALPQSIWCSFSEETLLDEIRITFDPDMNNPGIFYSLPKFSPSLVKAYKLIVVSEDGKNITLANVKDNYLRLRVHTFEPIKVKKIIVEVEETAGDASARISEMRAYYKKSLFAPN
jgi:hypothetical protein